MKCACGFSPGNFFGVLTGIRAIGIKNLPITIEEGATFFSTGNVSFMVHR